MSCRMTFDSKPGYLHAVVTGRNTRENVVRYLAEVRRECQARGCTRLLIEERLEGPRLDRGDVFDVASGGAAPGLPLIAYVDVNAQGTLMNFAEDVAFNRGVRIRVFGSVPEAERWLLGG